MAAATISSDMPSALNDTPTVNPKLRKRTKTGCLTCRKRRIKCGEERPTCNNCIKSKRHCEGYNQRVVFKTPIGDWPGVQHGASTLPYHTGLLPGTTTAHQRPVPPPIHTQDTSGGQLHHRPMYGIPINEHGQAVLLSTPTMISPGYQAQQQATPLPSPFNAPPSFTPISPPHFQPIFSAQAFPQPPVAISSHTWPQQQLQTPPHVEAHHFPHLQSTQVNPNLDYNRQRQHEIGQQQLPSPTTTAQDFKPSFATSSIPSPVPSAALHSSETVKREDSESQWSPHGEPSTAARYQTVVGPSVEQIPAYLGQFVSQSVTIEPETTIQTPIPISATQATFPAAFAAAVADSPNELLIEAAVEQEDDDYYDVQSDEEMDLDPSQAMIKAYETQRDFSLMLALHRDSTSELSMRRYDTFIYAGILDHYRPEWSANPLKNPNTARVFMHFITSTGPTLSIFERQPRNTSALFDEFPPSVPRQSLWTYTMPLLALSHQGLLHAMLALSSLHIAKLQRASKTPSLKHYTYAVKRMNRCVGNPKKRLQPTTLAATLLLAFYEVMTAEHLKWCSHLSGAKSLISELNYLSMTKETRMERAEEARRQSYYQGGSMAMQQVVGLSSPPEDAQRPIDEHVVSSFFGKKLSYDDFGRIVEDQPNGRRRDPSTPFDLARFELYQDLFWWYVKQDCYQSIISGNKVLLDYNRWADCPPRSSLGSGDTVYGSFDHLMLLLGRVADFTARDRSRKIKVVDANGGQWRPAPGMNLGGPPPGGPNRGGPPVANVPPQNPGAQRMQSLPSQQMPGPPNQPNPMQGPTFYGMAPSAPVHTPSAYKTNASSPSAHSPHSTKSEIDLTAATDAALEEWQQIRKALDLFQQKLGPHFQPLPSEFHHPQPQPASPFGGILQYRSYDIANIWALYYMCHIILLRAHPHMPPAAMVASGVAAVQTAPYANLIGQIAAGIHPPPKDAPLNPSVGACLCEVCIPLFFAGVQYREPAQRAWLVHRLRDIEGRTGWGSLGMIAHGCETAWVKAAEAGRGPPWTRTPVDEGNGSDERITRRGGHYDPISEPKDYSDRRFIHVNPSTRVHWAVGLLAMEEDLERDVE